MDITKFSTQYRVKPLLPEDAQCVYEALRENTIFYHFHPPAVTIESILEDMEALPPKKTYEEKHYIGFYHSSNLVAVMDMIEHYPHNRTALIGFFAMNPAFQGRGIGTEIISECVLCWKQLGYQTVRLGIDEGNPQSKAFWLKNGFQFTGEVIPNEYSSYYIMEKTIQ